MPHDVPHCVDSVDVPKPNNHFLCIMPRHGRAHLSSPLCSFNALILLVLAFSQGAHGWSATWCCGVIWGEVHLGAVSMLSMDTEQPQDHFQLKSVDPWDDLGLNILSMASPQVLVLGGTGFRGHLTTEQLVRDGHNVTVISRGFRYWDIFQRLAPHITHWRPARQVDGDPHLCIFLWIVFPNVSIKVDMWNMERSVLGSGQG